MATNAEIIERLEASLDRPHTPHVSQIQILQALAIANVAEELRLKREAAG
ncbi:hypothetical protein [Microbacterium sp. NPDC089696]